jgi:hypothetical protein
MGESLEALIARADADLLDARRNRRRIPVDDPGRYGWSPAVERPGNRGRFGMHDHGEHATRSVRELTGDR